MFDTGEEDTGVSGRRDGRECLDSDEAHRHTMLRFFPRAPIMDS